MVIAAGLLRLEISSRGTALGGSPFSVAIADPTAEESAAAATGAAAAVQPQQQQGKVGRPSDAAAWEKVRIAALYAPRVRSEHHDISLTPA